MSLSTHVLDAVRGRAAAGVAVRLDRAVDQDWLPLTRTVTNADGRVPELAGRLDAGIYRLVFDTEAYLQVDTLYPEVSITIRVTDPDQHYHVPLLLSPFAYSTYRGT